jgi:hypothetical protein
LSSGELGNLDGLKITEDIKKLPRFKPWRVVLEVADLATTSLRNNHLAHTADWLADRLLLL